MKHRVSIRQGFFVAGRDVLRTRTYKTAHAPSGSALTTRSFTIPKPPTNPLWPPVYLPWPSVPFLMMPVTILNQRTTIDSRWICRYLQMLRIVLSERNLRWLTLLRLIPASRSSLATTLGAGGDVGGRVTGPLVAGTAEPICWLGPDMF